MIILTSNLIFVACENSGVDCKNGGKCVDNGGQAACSCPTNFSGKYCELKNGRCHFLLTSIRIFLSYLDLFPLFNWFHATWIRIKFRLQWRAPFRLHISPDKMQPEMDLQRLGKRGLLRSELVWIQVLRWSNYWTCEGLLPSFMQYL